MSQPPVFVISPNALMKKAAAVGIEVPYTTYTYHAIRALEEKNAGLIR